MRKLFAFFSFILYAYLDGTTVKLGENSLYSLRNTISYNDFGRIKNNCLYVNSNIDLQGKECRIPKGITIVIDGGIIRNGTLIGNHTKLKCEKKAFDNVRIKGSWNVPSISTSLFVNLKDVNALKNVIALAHTNVQNSITIENGDYKVAASDKNRICLLIPGNTTLIIEGTIQLEPNNLPLYEIIRAIGNNIIIKGHGTIIGDKHTHLGEKGEWGMGVRFHSATNASVSGLKIKNCWGDCIYVGGNSRNILIEGCLLDHGRRQGISVTKAANVKIKNCKITNVSGTAPEYAIDLEPNKGDTVKNVTIDHVEVSNCMGGILVVRSKSPGNGGAYIGDFKIKDCTIAVETKHPIYAQRFHNATIENCIIRTNNKRAAIHVAEANKVIVKNNRITIDKSIASSIKNSLKNMIGKGENIPIHFKECRKVISINNIIVEK